MDRAVKLHDMQSPYGECPECNVSLIIWKNVDIEEARLCLWTCPKCFTRFVEVLLIK